MAAFARFITLVLSMILAAAVHAQPIDGNIIFSNKSAHAFTITPAGANDCVTIASQTAFTVYAQTNHEYQIQIKSGCTDAAVELHYSQQYDSVRTVKGTMTYSQIRQNGKWMAQLHMNPTPPEVHPTPILYRSACGYRLLFCASQPTPLTNHEIFARFTVIPVAEVDMYHRDFMSIGY